MPKVIVLGSSYAVATENHENTHLVVVGEETTVLVDCVGSPLVRLARVGVDPLRISRLVLTHFHPDHVSALPLFLMNLWLLKRREPLHLHGLSYTLERVQKMMELFNWSSWPNFYPVEFHALPEKELAPILNGAEFSIYASPVRHLTPTIGLRIEFPTSKKALAYSCDTEPCQQVVRLARGADVLLHEATGSSPGHTSAYQAGSIAAEAGVAQLYLIHYPTRDFDPHSLLPEAADAFGGPVSLAYDGMVFDFQARLKIDHHPSMKSTHSEF